MSSDMIHMPCNMCGRENLSSCKIVYLLTGIALPRDCSELVIQGTRRSGRITYFPTAIDIFRCLSIVSLTEVTYGR